MPKVVTTPPALKSLRFYGLDFQWREGDTQATAECPFCGKDKFSVEIDTSKCKCWKSDCAAAFGLNSTSFVWLLYERSAALQQDYTELVADRRYLSGDELGRFGVARSILTGDWLVPGHDLSGKLKVVYRYVTDLETGKRHLRCSGVKHQLAGMPLFDKTKDTTFVMEGFWDAVALSETLRSQGRDEANVLAVPGCNVFIQEWASLFSGKRVVLMYDSDHPRKHEQTGEDLESVGLAGMKRVAWMLGSAKEPPAEIHYLRWGEDGYDPELPSGFDVRDWLTEVEDREDRLSALLAKVHPIPEEWLQRGDKEGVGAQVGGGELRPLPCENWNELINSWRKALKWIDGLDRALSVMLSVITSTMMRGDQLWAKIIGPPSSGKSVLCEATSVARKYVRAISVIRGFHSGFKSDRDGTEDNSLIPKIVGKTLVTKDGDTLLQSPNLEQILSEARDLYDGTARTHYRNRMGKDYQNIRMTWLLCGTESLRSLDDSELGERFLDCIVVDEIDPDLEDEIGWRVINRAIREVCHEADGRPDTQESPELTRAKQLTGGYIEWLRTDTEAKVSSVEMSDEAMKTCQQLAVFISYMRSRPSRRQEEKAQRELSFRLISQIGRLAMCLAVVLNRRSVDAEVMRRVKQVALDTARGRTIKIAKHLYEAGDVGMEVRAISLLTGEPELKEAAMLRHLRKIKAVEAFRTYQHGVSSRQRWRLSPRLMELWEQVMG